MTFKKYKKSSTDITRLLSEIEKTNNPEKSNQNNFSDDRFWQPTVDKAGNGYAVIRFLPTPAVDDDGDDGFPWVRVFRHSFQGPTGSWYIENSLTTIGQKDPVGELNSILWNSGNEADKEIARKRKRKLQYISNILVINDPGNPENNGKIKLFSYGKKIWEKLEEVMNPKFEDETAINPFDFETGANFKLKIRQVDGYRNYDKSEFDSPSAVEGDWDQLYNTAYSLKAFIDPSNFKTYDELKNRLDKVLGEAPSSPRRQGQGQSQGQSQRKVVKERDEEPEIEEDSGSTYEIDEDDEDLKYFQQLADE